MRENSLVESFMKDYIGDDWKSSGNEYKNSIIAALKYARRKGVNIKFGKSAAEDELVIVSSKGDKRLQRNIGYREYYISRAVIDLTDKIISK